MNGFQELECMMAAWIGMQKIMAEREALFKGVDKYFIKICWKNSIGILFTDFVYKV